MEDSGENEQESSGSTQDFPRAQHVWWLFHPSSHQQDEAKVALKYGYNIYKTNMAIGPLKRNKFIFSFPFFSGLAEELNMKSGTLFCLSFKQAVWFQSLTIDA